MTYKNNFKIVKSDLPTYTSNNKQFSLPPKRDINAYKTNYVKSDLSTFSSNNKQFSLPPKKKRK